MKNNQYLKFIFFFSIIGLLLSGYLVFIHYSQESSPCDFSETFQCSLVNRSKYSEIFSIPVSVLGFFGYLSLGLISLMVWKGFLDKLFFSKVLFGLSITAVIISLYLTYVEFFLIKAVCILCVISQIDVLAIMGLSYKNLKGD